MNVQLAQDSVRFRITADEAHRLSCDGIIIGGTNLPDGQYFSYAISVVRTLSVEDETMELETGIRQVHLRVRNDVFERQLVATPSKRGIVSYLKGRPGKPLQVELQIDLHSRSRHPVPLHPAATVPAA